MFYYVWEDSQTTAYTEHLGTSKFWLLKSLLEINANSLVIRQKQKQSIKLNCKSSVPYNGHENSFDKSQASFLFL